MATMEELVKRYKAATNRVEDLEAKVASLESTVHILSSMHPYASGGSVPKDAPSILDQDRVNYIVSGITNTARQSSGSSNADTKGGFIGRKPDYPGEVVIRPATEVSDLNLNKIRARIEVELKALVKGVEVCPACVKLMVGERSKTPYYGTDGKKYCCYECMIKGSD